MTELAAAPAETRTETKRINHWIGGRAVAGESGRSGAVWNPATGEQSGAVDFASVEEIDRAVAAAKAAFPAWRATSLSRKSEIYFRIRKLLDEHREDLARLLTAEHGKVLSDAMGEVARGLEVIEFACGIPHLLKGSFSEQASTGIDVYSIRQPLGVVAGITPFNFPAMVPMWMWGPALACGNTFVLKPSEKDPSASILTAELLKEAGVPDGVFNVVHGDKVAVDRILEHPDIAAVSFVGSTPIARYIYETGTKHGKRVQALGGAKNHMIVLPDADLEMAADAAVSAAYGSAGERCMAISQVVAVGGVGDDARRGDQGATAEDQGRQRARRRRRDGPARHARSIATRSRATSRARARRARRSSPTAARRRPRATASSSASRSSTTSRPRWTRTRTRSSAPCSASRASTPTTRRSKLVNENPYGNGTAIFTRDGGVARQFQFDVEAGMVGINVPIPVPVAYYSFGGWKASLFGDTHIYGPEGINFYTRGKVVTSRWPDPATRRSTSASRRRARTTTWPSCSSGRTARAARRASRRAAAASSSSGGEAGVGKTALVRALRGAGRRRPPRLVREPRRPPTPLGPFLDLGDRRRGDSSVESPAGDAARPSRTALVVLEDVHWADQSSLDVLRVLGRRIDATPARSCSPPTATTRSTGDHPLRVVLGELASAPGVVRLGVPRLSPRRRSRTRGAARAPTPRRSTS